MNEMTQIEERFVNGAALVQFVTIGDYSDSELIDIAYDAYQSFEDKEELSQDDFFKWRCASARVLGYDYDYIEDTAFSKTFIERRETFGFDVVVWEMHFPCTWTDVVEIESPTINRVHPDEACPGGEWVLESKGFKF